MFEGCYDMGREDRMEGVFYLFAIKLLDGPGFAYKQSNQLRSKALYWRADIVGKACALGFVVFLMENL